MSARTHPVGGPTEGLIHRVARALDADGVIIVTLRTRPGGALLANICRPSNEQLPASTVAAVLREMADSLDGGPVEVA